SAGAWIRPSAGRGSARTRASWSAASPSAACRRPIAPTSTAGWRGFSARAGPKGHPPPGRPPARSARRRIPAGGRRSRPPPPPGGEAVRQAAHDPLRLQGEIVLATLVNHPDLIHARLEAIAHMALPAGQLDKLRQAIIDLAARTPDLDVEALKQHLLSQGFTA